MIARRANGFVHISYERKENFKAILFFLKGANNLPGSSSSPRGWWFHGGVFLPITPSNYPEECQQRDRSAAYWALSAVVGELFEELAGNEFCFHNCLVSASCAAATSDSFLLRPMPYPSSSPHHTIFAEKFF